MHFSIIDDKDLQNIASCVTLTSWSSHKISYEYITTLQALFYFQKINKLCFSTCGKRSAGRMGGWMQSEIMKGYHDDVENL